jgi:hypothetical protein
MFSTLGSLPTPITGKELGGKETAKKEKIGLFSFV